MLSAFGGADHTIVRLHVPVASTQHRSSEIKQKRNYSWYLCAPATLTALVVQTHYTSESHGTSNTSVHTVHTLYMYMYMYFFFTFHDLATKLDPLSVHKNVSKRDKAKYTPADLWAGEGVLPKATLMGHWKWGHRSWMRPWPCFVSTPTRIGRWKVRRTTRTIDACSSENVKCKRIL